MVPSLGRSWLVWASAALFFGYQFLLRVSPSVMTQELMRDFQVDACALGTLTSCYFYAYVLLQLPVGTLLDKLGPRRLLTIAALLCTGGSILFATADTIVMASAGRFLIGAGSAFGFLSCMKVGALWFPPQRISMVVGFTLFLGTIGAAGVYPMSFLVAALGWREAVLATAGGGVALAIFIAIVVRDHPPKSLQSYIENHHAIGNPSLSIWEGLKVITKKAQTWLLAFYGFMMFIPLVGFADLWGVPFLIRVHHMNEQYATLSTSFLYVGVALGTPLFAFISDRFQQFKFTLLGAALGVLIPFVVIVYGPDLPVFVIISLLFVAGLFLGGQFMTYSIVTEINPLSVSGLATGFQNMVCLLSGIIFQPFIGWLLDIFWEEAYENGIRLYSSAAYQMAITSVIVAILFAILASLFIREAYPERK
ncbi:MAG TPA: MFS transporter [Alphaproteobacteria bacterium]|nr:MFS transporter [Alphaproteobacteria bacterium]